MFDPLALGRETARRVTRGRARRYYRFRPARFYGGIATADCLGCNLRCVFCWAWREVHHAPVWGRLYEPEAVAARLTAIARERHYSQVRVSGNEPTLVMPHLLEVLARLPKEYAFILETNGLVLGAEKEWARELAAFPQVFVRVSLKGCTPEEFSRLTGAHPGAFELPFLALENLLAAGVDCHAAVMLSFSPPEARTALRKRLAAIHPALADFEAEELILYPPVAARLARRGIKYLSAWLPSGEPAPPA